jgi:hypothetical protein
MLPEHRAVGHPHWGREKAGREERFYVKARLPNGPNFCFASDRHFRFSIVLRAGGDCCDPKNCPGWCGPGRGASHDLGVGALHGLARAAKNYA